MTPMTHASLRLEGQRADHPKPRAKAKPGARAKPGSGVARDFAALKKRKEKKRKEKKKAGRSPAPRRSLESGRSPRLRGTSLGEARIAPIVVSELFIVSRRTPGRTPSLTTTATAAPGGEGCEEAPLDGYDTFLCFKEY